MTTTEALMGFALLTAGVSAIILIHPALGRMRALARRVSVVARVAEESGVPFTSHGGEHFLEAFAFDVARVRVDLIHFPILFYFYSPDEQTSLPRALLHLAKLAGAAGAGPCEDRAQKAELALRLALHDLAQTLRQKFIDGDFADYKLQRRVRSFRAAAYTWAPQA